MSVLGCSGYLYPSGLVFKKCRALSTPSCGMFVYRDDTFIEAILQFVGSWVASIWLNSVASLTYEGRFLTWL